jgi:hypothetical protein
MAKLKLEFAELHKPLFLAGTNMKEKLHSLRDGDPELIYDREEKELLVTYKGKMAIIPVFGSVSSMTPAGTTKITPLPAPPPPGKKVNAQVSTPMGHVFEGQGAGQTGVSTSVK